MESASADATTDPLHAESPNGEGGRRSVWVVLGFVVLGVLGALAGIAGYLRQSELLDAETEFPAEVQPAEPFVAYASVPPLEPAVEVEPLVEAPSEPEWAAEPVAVHVVEDARADDRVDLDDAVAEHEADESVVDDRPGEVTALDVPALDESPANEVAAESGESRIDFEPAALFADPLAMRDRRGSLRR
jgi:hypothetical protein